MAEDKRHDAEATPTAPSSSVVVVQTPENTAQTHSQAEIDADNLREREHVLPMESVPPADQKSDMPADFKEIRKAARPPVVDNERRYGPLSGSMWFLAVAVTAFVLVLLITLLS
jgi:hypothetical protein